MIQVITTGSSGYVTCNIYVNGVYTTGQLSSVYAYTACTAIIPSASTYTVTGQDSLASWAELR